MVINRIGDPVRGMVVSSLKYLICIQIFPLNFISLRKIIKGKIELSYSVPNPSSLLERFVVNYDGRSLEENWNNISKKREVLWMSLASECDIYGKCGAFGSCDPKKSPISRCLKEFKPTNEDEWRKGNWTSGCKVRRTPLLQCGAIKGKADRFSRLKNMKVPDYAYWFTSNSEDDCEQMCLRNCSCLAYAYSDSQINCMMWTVSLIDLQQFPANGVDLHIRLAHSEFDEPKWKLIITIVLAILGGIIVIVLMYYGWKLLRQQYGSKITNREFPFHSMLDDKMDQVQIQDLPLYKFQKLLVATNCFSLENKIGRG